MTWAVLIRAAVAALLLALTLAAPAEATSGWSASPATPDGERSNRPYLVYDIAPGERIGDHVVVANTGDEPIELEVYATDAFSDEAARFSLLTAAEQPDGAGRWLRTGVDHVRVPVGERRLIPVSLEVPRGTPAGDYVAGVVTSATRSVRDENGAAVLLDSRLAVRVYLRVSGDAPADVAASGLSTAWDPGAWWNPFDDRVRVSYRVANPGAVRLAVAHEADAIGPLGVDLGQRRGTVVPDLLPSADVAVGDGTPVGADVSDVGLMMPLGRADVEVTVRAVDRVTGSPLAPVVLSSRVTATPWPLLIALPCAAALGYAGFVVWRRRRRAARPAASASPSTPENDSAPVEGGA